MVENLSHVFITSIVFCLLMYIIIEVASFVSHIRSVNKKIIADLKNPQDLPPKIEESKSFFKYKIVKY